MKKEKTVKNKETENLDKLAKLVKEAPKNKTFMDEKTEKDALASWENSVDDKED